MPCVQLFDSRYCRLQCAARVDGSQLLAILGRGVEIRVYVDTVSSMRARGSEGPGVKRVSFQRALDFHRAIGLRRHAGDANGRRLAFATVDREIDCHADNGKAGSRMADFNVSLRELSFSGGNADFAKDFAGLEGGSEHLDEEVGGFDGAVAFGAASDELGVKREDGGGPVSRGVGVDEASADGALVAH